jgi:hypothetical protein
LVALTIAVATAVVVGAGQAVAAALCRVHTAPMFRSVCRRHRRGMWPVPPRRARRSCNAIASGPTHSASVCTASVLAKSAAGNQHPRVRSQLASADVHQKRRAGDRDLPVDASGRPAGLPGGISSHERHQWLLGCADIRPKCGGLPPLSALLAIPRSTSPSTHYSHASSVGSVEYELRAPRCAIA